MKFFMKRTSDGSALVALLVAVRVQGIFRNYTRQTPIINGIRQITAPDFCNF